MSFVIQQRPINGASKWNAVRNPIVYKGQRRDYAWTVLDNNAGFARILIFGVDVTAQLTIGETMRVVGDAGTIDFTSTITSSIFSGGSTRVTFAQPYTVGSSANGFANDLTSRTNYRLEVEVYNAADVLLNSKPLTYTPDKDYKIMINTSVVLSNVLTSDNSYDYTVDLFEIVKDAPGASVEFYIKYKEVWTGSAEAQTNDNANKYYAVDGSRQIGDPFGGNLSEFVCLNAVEGKFLTKFDVLPAWEGYPLIVSALIDGGVSNDIYGYIYGLSELTAAPVPLKGTMVDLIIKKGFTTSDDSFQIFKNSGPPVGISEEKFFKVRCPLSNSLMLIGRNSYGGMFQWVFDYNQIYTFVYADGSKAKRYRMQANSLTLNEWEALNDFFTLGEIYRENITELTTSVRRTKVREGQQVYVLNKDTLKTTGVIVISVDNQVETKNFSNIFEIIIEFPEIL